MKNISRNAMVLALSAVLFTIVQADATVKENSADEVTKAIWATTQEVALTQEDKVSNLAWSTNVEAATPEKYELVACAADLEGQDQVDKITKAVWSDSKKIELSQADKLVATAWGYTNDDKTLSQQDTITNLAWSKTVEEEKYDIVACAAEIDEENPADTVAKRIWSK